MVAVSIEPRAEMPTDVLTATLALSLWVGSGSFVLAIADGLGGDPTRRFLVGLFLVSLSAVALLLHHVVCAWLVARPWIVIPVAALQLAAAAVDGLVGGPYVAFSLTSIGLAVVAARARTVWICVLVLVGGYAGLVLVDHSVAGLADDKRLGSVVGALVSFPVAALLLMSLRRRFTRFLENVELTLEQIREGTHACTPALASGLANAPALLPASRPRLTLAERRVVDGLAAGAAPKQLAHEWGISLATVRTHIKHAKRKTGARTLPELVLLVARDHRAHEQSTDGR